MADYQQPSTVGVPDRFWSFWQCVGISAVGDSRKQRPRVGAPLYGVRVLGASHDCSGYWGGPRGHLPFYSLAIRFSRVGCDVGPGTRVDLRLSADAVCYKLAVEPPAIALQRSPRGLSGEHMGHGERCRVAAWPDYRDALSGRVAAAGCRHGLRRLSFSWRMCTMPSSTATHGLCRHPRPSGGLVFGTCRSWAANI